MSDFVIENGRLKKYDVDTLYQVMVDEGWYFRYPTDIDALNIEEDILILRMRSVPAMDATALRTLENVFDTCKKNNTALIFSHVNMQPYSVMEKSGFIDKVGKDKFCKNIDEALKLAESLEAEYHQERKKN